MFLVLFFVLLLLLFFIIDFYFLFISVKHCNELTTGEKAEADGCHSEECIIVPTEIEDE